MEKRELRIRRDAAEHIAYEVGFMLLKKDFNRDFKIEEKHKNDYVTEADKESERMIINYLSFLFPEDGFHCEESGNSKNAFPRWIIDPIDGTMNFMRGMPNYTISIAFEETAGNPLIGIVYNVRQKELFSAIKGEGSFLNGEHIEASNVQDNNKAIIIVKAPHRRKEWSHKYCDLFGKIFKQSSDLRCLGSVALEICYIAAGRVDGIFEYNLGYWDIAASICILKEAGGMIEAIIENDNVSKEPCDIIASNVYLFQWLSKLVRDYGTIRDE